MTNDAATRDVVAGDGSTRNRSEEGAALSIEKTDPPGGAPASHAMADTLKSLHEIRYALDQAAIVATTDQRGIITYVNDKFCEISKFSREELIGQDHRIINSSFHSKEFIRNLWTTIAKGKTWHG